MFDLHLPSGLRCTLLHTSAKKTPCANHARVVEPKEAYNVIIWNEYKYVDFISCAGSVHNGGVCSDVVELDYVAY